MNFGVRLPLWFGVVFGIALVMMLVMVILSHDAQMSLRSERKDVQSGNTRRSSPPLIIALSTRFRSSSPETDAAQGTVTVSSRKNSTQPSPPPSAATSNSLASTPNLFSLVRTPMFDIERQVQSRIMRKVHPDLVGTAFFVAKSFIDDALKVPTIRSSADAVGGDARENAILEEVERLVLRSARERLIDECALESRSSAEDAIREPMSCVMLQRFAMVK